jgi:ribosomal-protein-alanine N-acetyltransferase
MKNLNNTLNFSICRLTDLDEIEEIEKRSFADPWTKNLLVSELENELVSFFCLYIEDQVVGYISLSKILDEGNINNIAVHPDHREKGYGKYLIDKITEYALNHKISFITLEVRESNLPAILLYEKTGFIILGKRKHYYKNPEEDALIMIKKLK